MLKTKRLLGIAILICALTFPTSAFASKDNTSESTKKSFSQSFNQIISNIFGNNKINTASINYSESYEKEIEKKNKEDEDWGHTHPEESSQIWKNWFCY
jgi:hypothetical protein